MFQQFEDKPAEAGARKRKALSIVAAVGVYALVGGGLLLFAASPQTRVREQPVEVTFAPKAAPPPAPKAAPPPAPKPRPAPKRTVAARTRELQRKRLALVAPKEIPLEAPLEAEPTASSPSAMGLDDLDERGSTASSGEEVAPPTPAEDEGSAPVRPRSAPLPTPPPPAEEKVATPIYLPERASAPRPLPDNPQPKFPAARLREGVADVVALKAVVTERGTVEDVHVLRGRPEFVASVMEVLPRWRFTPAEFEGERLRVFKIVEVDFRIRD